MMTLEEMQALLKDSIPGKRYKHSVNVYETALKLAEVHGLAKVVYLADMIEPGRDFPGVEELRKLARKDLDKAMLLAYSNTICYLLEGGLLIHPHCIRGYNELILAAKTK